MTQEHERGKYGFGRMLVYLAEAVSVDADLLQVSRPICERLSEVTQETVNLAVLEKQEVVNIDQVIGASGVVSYNWVGKRNPISCTSTGKVLLAYLPQQEQKRFLKRLEPCTERSIQDMNVLASNSGDSSQGIWLYPRRTRAWLQRSGCPYSFNDWKCSCCI